ncbi:MAG: hypothetical protein ACC641_00425 [Acidiferrobacterales bacterium]
MANKLTFLLQELLFNCAVSTAKLDNIYASLDNSRYRFASKIKMKHKLSFLLIIYILFTTTAAVADIHIESIASDGSGVVLFDQNSDPDVNIHNDHCGHLGSHFAGLSFSNSITTPTTHDDTIPLVGNTFLSSSARVFLRPPISRQS